MAKTIDMIGKRFGRLQVIEDGGRSNSGRFLWKCLCDCGTIKTIRGDSLRDGSIKSCGCFQKDQVTTHGMTKTREFRSWTAMLNRCKNPNNDAYSHYGGRGITVCERWDKFENFFDDMGKRPKELTIERINNDLGYCKENCKWGTNTEQSRNQGLSKRNKTGVRGVGWSKQARKYRAIIIADRKQYHIGYFDTLEQAAEARAQAEQKYWR